MTSLILSIAGPAVGVLAIITSIILARKSRERRQLVYEISTTPQLLSVGREIRDEVEVTYQGRHVTNLAGVTVTLTSAGNRSVQVPAASQYETPVTIEFGDGAEILGEPRITETVPPDLTASVKFDAEKVTLEPVLLNPGQSITVFTLLTGMKHKVRVTAHIRDVETTQAQDYSRGVAQRAALLGAVGGLLAIAFAVWGAATNVLDEQFAPLIAGAGGGVLITSVGSVFSNDKGMRRWAWNVFAGAVGVPTRKRQP